ncbi:MAG: hydrogenase formation protein HypD [Candidatus Omnitrophica bacterium]|nr:hydrogenase formation protein HypD [Candidatus Omnitrophota bacterium]
MKYIDEYRDIKLVKKVAKGIRAVMPPRQVNIMEVCGTHTQNFFRFGLDKMLPGNLRLIAGPGCPVCVSSQEYIDAAIALTRRKEVLILTFGDMLRIPGTLSTLENERARSGNIRVVYSPLESINVARANPDKSVVFLAVGFETTIPTIALTILAARKEKIFNLTFLCALKLITPAMEYLCRDKRLKLDGFLCPGHVSSIIGTRPYEFLVKKYRIGSCVAGFEPLDILEGIYLLMRQLAKNKPRVDNQYIRAVKKRGNHQAVKIINRVFQPANASWRGLGKIPKSGLMLKQEFLSFDASKRFVFKSVKHGAKIKKCLCGEVLKGLIRPNLCPLFARACTPDNPVGPCMVSHEGACNAYFKYCK